MVQVMVAGPGPERIGNRRDGSGRMIVAHKCLRCGNELSSKAQAMECSACGASWPVVGGVPAYRSTEYFGEVSREEMLKLVRRAEEGNWLRAVRTQFKDS